MVGRIGVDRHGDVRRAGRPGDPRVEHLHAARRLHEVDPVGDLVVPQSREGIAERPRDARVRDRVGMGRAVGVLEPGRGERAGHRPGDGIRDVGPRGVGGRRPVQVRRRVEVAGHQRRDAAPQGGPDAAEQRADLRHPRDPLVAQHLRERLPVAHEVRAVRIRREVLVGEREDLAGLDLREHVGAARVRRVDQREPRDDVEPVAPVRPAERLGDPRRVALRLLQADDVGVRRPDRADDAAEVHDVTAEPDVERHDPDVGGHARRRRGGRGGAQRRREDRQRRRRAAHAG